MSNQYNKMGFVYIFLLTITACTTQKTTNEHNPGEIQTSMAGSVAETITAYAETVQPTPRDTPTVYLIPTDTLAPLATKVMDSLTEDASCRMGPDPEYDIASYVTHGIPLEVIGINNDGTWYLINNTPSPDPCWIEGKLLDQSLNEVNFHVLTPPPTPTPLPPGFNISNLGWQACYESLIYVFLITNTGNITWESGIVSTSNASTGEKTRFETNAFGTKTYIEPGYTYLDFFINSKKLVPKQTMSIPSAGIKLSPDGNVFATVTLCSENDGGGLCVTRSLKFSP